eukprot:1223660-Rhodomonas_salina.1
MVLRHGAGAGERPSPSRQRQRVCDAMRCNAMRCDAMRSKIQCCADRERARVGTVIGWVRAVFER